jgi:hypothetical protein
VQAGQEVWVPADRPQTALAQQVQATDEALAAVKGAEHNLQDPPANADARQELEDARTSARTTFESAVDAELRQRAQALAGGPAATPTETQYTEAGEQIKARYQASPGDTGHLQSALDQLADKRHQEAVNEEADQLIQDARKTAGDPPAQLKAAKAAMEGATPEVRDAALQRAEWGRLQQEAADWATEPLAGGHAMKAIENAQGGQQAPMAQTAERLKQITEGMSAEEAAELTRLALPDVEQYTKDYQAQIGFGSTGPQGMRDLLTVMDRGLGTAQGQKNLERIAAQGLYSRDAIYQHVAGGGSPAYAVALGGDEVLQEARNGIAAWRGQIETTVKDYAEHTQELNWLISQHGGAMTPEQLQQAIEQYGNDKGADWKARSEALQAQLADQGETLLKQLMAMPEGDPAVADALDDPNVSLAISNTLQQKPEVLDGEFGQSLMAFFADPTTKGAAKSIDVVRKLSSEIATEYMKRVTTGAMSTFNPSDPASVERATQSLDRLRNSQLASLLGVSTSEMDSAVDALKKAMPAADDLEVDITRKLTTLNDELGAIGDKVNGRLGWDPADANRGQKAFDKSTVAGQAFRGLGMVLGLGGLLASTGVAADNGSVKNWLKVAGDGLSLGQKGLEMAVITGKLDDATRIGKVGTQLGSSLAGRLLGVGMSVFDFWSAGELVYKGVQTGDADNYVGAGLYAAGGVGAVAAGLFTGPIGWAGLAVMGLAAIGQVLWSRSQESKVHEPEKDGGTSMTFLQNAGFSEAAARALCDQSGDGHSVVPLLNRYAALKGLDLTNPADQQAFTQWINAMPAEQLAALRDNLHHTADDLDGDASGFGKTADDDKWVVPDIADRPWFTRFGDMGPESMAQLDAQLKVLGLPELGKP